MNSPVAIDKKLQKRDTIESYIGGPREWKRQIMEQNRQNRYRQKGGTEFVCCWLRGSRDFTCSYLQHIRKLRSSHNSVYDARSKIARVSFVYPFRRSLALSFLCVPNFIPYLIFRLFISISLFHMQSSPVCSILGIPPDESFPRRLNARPVHVAKRSLHCGCYPRSICFYCCSYLSLAQLHDAV